MHTQSPSSLEKFVMGDHNAPISVATLVKARLAGYAYRTIPEDHALREQLRQPRRNLEIRHQLVKHQLKPLFKGWSDAGIKIMLIKGFWLAEFIYERPGDRGYGDIDVLMPEDQTQQAIQLAQDLGWKVVFNNKTIGNPNSHEEANLTSSDGLVTIDLHRYALQSAQSWGEYHPKRLTSAFWETAIQRSWEGTTIWLPDPKDGLILNLLNRARGDHWKRRISDLPDARSIVKTGIFQEQLMARATELNVKNSITAALETCNPWTNQISITPPNLWHRISLYVKTATEMGVYELEQFQYQLNRPIDSILGLITMLPILIRVKHALKDQPDLYLIFQKLEQRFIPQKNTSNRKIMRLTRGTKLALMLIGPRENACVPRSMALYLALRQHNIQMQFVSGVHRFEGKLRGHAWLELQGRPIEGLGDHDAPDLFKENFRYPINN
jgi:Uncharacterised nucleotidyltransferase/Transglutaminase-like superfamily